MAPTLLLQLRPINAPLTGPDIERVENPSPKSAAFTHRSLKSESPSLTVYSLNFSAVSALLVDSDRYASRIVSQILHGFGVARVQYAAKGEDAKRFLQQETFELLLCEAKLADLDAADFVGWVRRLEGQNRFVPIVVLSGYTSFSSVNAVRDSGANCVVRKPVSPKVLLDHIEWTATSGRSFLETGSGYIGPDRRFKVADGKSRLGRRAGDKSSGTGGSASSESPPPETANQTRVDVE